MVIELDPYILLSPEYETTYEAMYGRQPRCIPVGFKSNNNLPNIITETEREYSRMWINNPKYKKKK